MLLPCVTTKAIHPKWHVMGSYHIPTFFQPAIRLFSFVLLLLSSRHFGCTFAFARAILLAPRFAKINWRTSENDTLTQMLFPFIRKPKWACGLADTLRPYRPEVYKPGLVTSYREPIAFCRRIYVKRNKGKTIRFGKHTVHFGFEDFRRRSTSERIFP